MEFGGFGGVDDNPLEDQVFGADQGRWVVFDNSIIGGYEPFDRIE